MRKIITAALAAALIMPGVAMAQPGGPNGGGDHRGGDQRGPGNGGPGGGGDHRGPGNGGPGGGGWNRGPNGGWRGNDGRDWRQFRRGERFDMRNAPNYGVLDWHGRRGLRQPPRGYHWVRSGDDAVLVGIATGIVASVIVGAALH